MALDLTPRHDVTSEDIQAKLNSFKPDLCEKLEQRSDEWLRARKHRITGSKFGTAAGHCKYQSPAGCVREMLWNTFKGNDGNCSSCVSRPRTYSEAIAATAWGTAKEPVAIEAYTQFLRNKRKSEGFKNVDGHVFVEESGLTIRKSKPWFGASPDGIVHDLQWDEHGKQKSVLGLLEIKCPYSRRFKDAGQRFYPDIIPQHYYDQIMGLMGIFTENAERPLLWADFCVWNETGFQVSRFPFDRVYWEELDQLLNDFYMRQFLPALILKERGLLQPGEIQFVPPTVQIDKRFRSGLNNAQDEPPTKRVKSLKSIRHIFR